MRLAWSVTGAARIVLGVSLAAPLAGCAMLGLTDRGPTEAPVVRVAVSDAEIHLDPSTVHAGDISFVLEFPRDDSQHAPEGLFFVSRGGDPSAPAPLDGDDVARLEDGTDQGLAFDGGWGATAMDMRLVEGRYAFILRPKDGESTQAPRAVAVLDVLPCIDAVRHCHSSEASPTPDAGAQGDTGGWVTTSQFGTTVSALVMSDDVPAVGLVIVCQSGTTVALIVWTAELASGPIPVETRAGDAPVETATWVVSDGKTAGLIGAVEFARSLLGETRLVARAPTADGGSTTATFDINGVDKAMADVRSLCGW